MKKYFSGLACLSLTMFLLGAGCNSEKNVGKVEPLESNSNILVERETPSEPSETKNGYMTYTNSDTGFRIDYPEGWQQKEDFYGSIVAFFSPLTSDTDEFSENVNVVVGDLQETELSLDEYTDLNIGQLETTIEGYNQTEKTRVKLGNLDADRVSYSGTLQGEMLSWTQWYLIEGGNAYVITYTGRGTEYTEFLKVGKEIADTFQIQ